MRNTHRYAVMIAIGVISWHDSFNSNFNQIEMIVCTLGITHLSILVKKLHFFEKSFGLHWDSIEVPQALEFEIRRITHYKYKQTICAPQGKDYWRPYQTRVRL